jgi:hypothetical protein
MRTIYFFIIEFLFLSFGIDVYSTNLSKGDIVVLTDFPYYLRNDIKISFTADVTTMGTFYIGRGYRSASGIYVKIDGTKITPITCDSSGNEIEKASIVNDLAISTFIKVILDVRHTTKYQYKCNLEIQSDNGKKIVELSENWSGVEDPVFVKSATSDGIICSNISLCATSSNFDKPIWVVGDSYLSIHNSERWPYYLEKRGYYNYLIESVSGGATQVYNDALVLLELGSPKYLVWCLGMNYGSDVDADTPRSSWKSEVDNIVSICSSRGITPILATIPCVPKKNHEGKNKYVRNSGYRYIDFAKAVHGETYTAGVDNWYEGYLYHGTEQKPDYVHPTALGAQALANQVLKDLPEITYLIGDVNLDKSVNYNDLNDLVLFILGGKPQNFSLFQADIDNNRKINVGDVTKLVNILKK